MLISKNTSTRTYKGFLIKLALILFITIVAVVMLSKVDFPTPNEEIEKIIPNEKLKIVK
jgi:uracil phosphoribosyltransferase